ncbi:MAG: hypothetical protein ACLUVG_06825 [Phocaeicola vulgatus]
MKHSFQKYICGAIALLIGASSCSDQFLKDKKDYNNMTTVDVYSDPQQATLCCHYLQADYIKI